MPPGVSEFTDWNAVVPAGAVVNGDGSWIEWADPNQPGKLRQVSLKDGISCVIDGEHSGTVTYNYLVAEGNTQTFNDFRDAFRQRTTAQLPGLEEV